MRAFHLILLCTLVTSSIAGAGAQFGFFPQSANAQALPGGCPGRWINHGGGMACQCPDGSLASGWPTITCGDGNRYQRPSYGDRCRNGATCPVGTRCSWMQGHCVPEGRVDCGNYNCEPGTKCARDRRYRSCLPLDAIDCGKYSCKAGAKCSRFGGCIPEDNVDCTKEFSCKAGTVCYRNKECLTKEAVKRREEAERKAKQEKKEAELRSDIEKKKAAHQKQDASARERLEKALAGTEQQRLQTEFANSGAQQSNTALQKLEAMARGENPSSGAPTASSPGPDLSVIQGSTAKRLQPSMPTTEQRTVGGATAPPASLSTFMCGTPPNQYPCPVTIEQRKSSPPTSETGRAESDLGPFGPSADTQAGKNAVRPSNIPPDPSDTEVLVRKAQQLRLERAVEICDKPFYKSGCVRSNAGGWGKSCRVCDRTRYCETNWRGQDKNCTVWVETNCRAVCK